MTMQVGMIGTDGIVLASDTLCNREPLPSSGPFQLGIAARLNYGTSKILIHDNGKIAVTCARDMLLATNLAESIFEGLTTEYWSNPGQRMRDIGTNEIAKRRWREVECLVALSEPIPALFHLQCLEMGANSSCEKITSFAFAGDATNAAIFWTLRYYQTKPVKELVSLAAQTVTDAGCLSSGNVGGVEVVYCDSSGFHRLAEVENRDLETKAKKHSEHIGNLIGGRDVRI